MASRKRPKLQLYIIIYGHRFGTDAWPILVDPAFPLPEITNELLNSVGVDNPELGERDDEWASWSGPLDLDNLPKLSGGVLDWRPD